MSLRTSTACVLLGLAPLVWSSVAVSHQGQLKGPLSDKGAIVSSEVPQEIQDVKIEEKLGQKLNLNLQLRNERGETVRLGDFFDGKTPVILSPVYFACPGLCNFHLNGLVEGLKDVDLSAGNQFQVLAISFDSKETPDIAEKKKESYLKVYDRAGTDGGWHFLTGDEENVTALMGSLGFKYKWNDDINEWAHASAAIIASPDGTITRYLPGIQFEAKDIRLAILESAKGKVGTFVDQLVLYCFKYNPHQSRYTIYAFNVMKLGGALMMLALGLWLIPFWMRHRRRSS